MQTAALSSRGRPSACPHVPVSASAQDTRERGEGRPSRPLFNLVTPLKDSSPKAVTFCGVGASTYLFWGDGLAYNGK